MRAARMMFVTGMISVLASSLTGACAEPSDRCQEVPDRLMDRIRSVLTEDAFVAGPGAAVKSSSYRHVYLVAVPIGVRGVGNETGVWATTSLDGHGTLTAAGEVASRLSSASWGPDDPREGDDGWQEAASCV
ncbi:hypothetical protein [Actinoalloteichus spitiensis]|uniref:hypothetical protein n=1 Tax=Actinoalloteichus spitiensis TaxID=252394 RepID=UPI0012F665FE|nr:hypothetical protein [Actinoalloteichus spitiensis]